MELETRRVHAPVCTSLVCDVIGLVITVLQLGQLIPQHLECAEQKSVVGLSPWLLLFGGLYTYLAALDIMISSSELWVCTAGSYRCFIDAQPLIQMIGSAVLSIALWYWYLKYAHAEGDEDIDEEERALASNFFYASTFGPLFFNAFLLIAILSSFIAIWVVVVYGVDSETAAYFAQTCGFTSTVLNGVMWLPQIYVTWSYKHKGALALGWVFASIVMDVVYSAYLDWLGVNFSVWANNITDGIQTTILFFIVVYFEYVDSREGRDSYGHIIGGAIEQPRLENKRRSTLREALSDKLLDEEDQVGAYGAA